MAPEVGDSPIEITEVVADLLGVDPGAFAKNGGAVPTAENSEQRRDDARVVIATWDGRIADLQYRVARDKFFGGVARRPASTTVGISSTVMPGSLLEIEVTAFVRR